MQQGYNVRKVLSKLRVVGTCSFFAPLVRRILRAHFRLVQNVPASTITFTVTTKHVYVDINYGMLLKSHCTSCLRRLDVNLHREFSPP